MKKRLITICLMLLCGLVGLFGCGPEPYENMSMSIAGLDTDSSIQLYIRDEIVSGQTVRSYDSKEITVTVTDENEETDLGVVVTGGGYIVETVVTDMGGGVTQLTLTARAQGTSTIHVLSREGNIAKSIDVKVDLVINGLEFDNNKISVIKQGSTIDLSNYQNFLTYSPKDTSQKDVKFEIMVPTNGVMMPNGQKYTYSGTADMVYAAIINDVLVTYENAIFPKNMATNESVVTIKVTSLYDETICDYVDFSVVNINSDIHLFINSDVNPDELIELSQNRYGCYEVVLANPSFDLGIAGSNYLYNRDLYFYVDYGGYSDTNYMVNTDIISDSNDTYPISLAMSSQEELANKYLNQFNGVCHVQSRREGRDFTHVFRVDHSSYEGKFTQEVKVTFVVKNFTREININSSTKGDDGIIYVYDIYSTGVLGSSLNIELNPYYLGQTYYVCFPREYIESLSLVKSSGKAIEMGVVEYATYTFDLSNATECSLGATIFLKHKYILAPNVDTIKMCVITYFDLASSDYKDDKEGYFNVYPVYDTVDIKIVKGMSDIVLEANNYNLDVTNKEYVDTGIKILELPQGNSFENTIASIEYTGDDDICYIDLQYDNDICSLVLKMNDEYLEGSVDITITTINGLSETINVETFIPIIYPNSASQDFDSRWAGSVSTMPLNVEIDTANAAYLGDMSLLYTVDNNTGDMIFDADLSSSTISVKAMNLVYSGFGYDVVDWEFSYTTFTDVVLASNSKIKLDVFNYLLYLDDSNRKMYEKINVNDSVTASYSILNYVKWNNGILETFSNKTINKNSPVKMTLKYTGFVEYFVAGEGYITQKVSVTHNINIWVYDIISSVVLNSTKSVTLYDSTSLGYYDSKGSVYDIDVDVTPSIENLGGWVSEANSLYGVNMVYNVADKEIATIYNDNRTNHIDIMLSDLYKIEGNRVTAEVGQRLIDFIDNDESGVSLTVEEILANIYRNKVSFAINIYVTQFNATTAINSIMVNLDIARMVENITLDADVDSGLYFEVRENEHGVLMASPAQVTMQYSTYPEEVYNSRIRLVNYFTASYYVEEGNILSGGQLTVIPRLSAGEYNLILAAEDSFYTYDDKVYYYSTYTSIKVKVADGSEDFPFEIRSVHDFEKMLLDISEGRNYHYVLVNDINLAGYQFKNYTFKNTIDEFVLDGEYQYVSNNTTMYRYSSIYGLNVLIDSASTEREVSVDSPYVNLGLFTSLPQNATIKNVTFRNTNLDVKLSATYRDKIYNVGILSGVLFGSIENTQVYSNMAVTLMGCQNVNIGSFAGMLANTYRYYGSGANVDGRIVGYPCMVETNISESGYNASVSLRLVGSTTIDNDLNIGGIVGRAVVSGLVSGNLESLNVAMSVNSSVYASIGGIVGKANNIRMINVTSVPIIWNETDVSAVDNFENISVGGLIGNSTSSVISDSIVYFNDLGSAFNGLNSAAIYANGHVGGLIGISLNDTVKYSYVRSFYDKVVTVNPAADLKIEYYGNIVLKDKGSVGGFSGTSNNISINASYVDADITALSLTNVSIAGMIGTSSKVSVSNSYVLGQINIISGDIIYNSLDKVSVLFGGDVAQKVAGSEVEYCVDVYSDDTTISDVYAIVNSSYYVIINEFNTTYTLYYEIGNTLEHVYKYDVLKETSSDTHYTTFEIFGGSVFNFDITDGEAFYTNGIYTYTVNTHANWFVSNDESVHINSITIGPDTTSLPIITKYVNGRFKLLFDIVPSGMSANIPECTRFSSKAHLDISKTIVDDATGTTSYETQVVLFYNEDSYGINGGNEYTISVSSSNNFSSTSVINISLNSNILSTTFVDIVLNNKVSLKESSNGTIIKLVNNTIYTMGEGLAVLTVSSTQDSSVYKNIYILVVKGVSEFMLYDYETEIKDPVQNTDTIYSPDSLETIYIDTYRYYKFETSNILKDNNGEHVYLPNTNIGYMIEVLETNESVKISIDGVDVSYRTDASNIYLFDSIDAMLISGVGFSEDDSFIYFRVTPFIIFNGMYGVADDFYTEKLYIDNNNFITSQPAKSSLYMLQDSDGYWCLSNCVLVPELSHDYAFRVVAKAYSVDFGSNLNEVNISPLATFKTTLNLETSNVNISNTFVCPDCGRVISVKNSLECACGSEFEDINIHNVRLLENLEMYLIGRDSFELYNGDLNIFNNSKITLGLKDRYLDSFLGTVVSSGLIEFTFENILLSKVTKDDHSGQHETNSYMISFSIVVNFNQTLYRNNADSYDLNNLNYVWVFVPETNINIDNPAIMRIGIEPLELNTITPRFYPNAEGLSAINEIEIPKEYESEYIVRNRKGLLKISLDPEFNNSSFVTVTANKTMKDRLTIGQMSALISNTGISTYVSGYEDVIYRDEVETSTHYGVRLSKLSTNYRNDILFDNVYYISLILNASSAMVGANIDIDITSYKIVDGENIATYTRTVTLKVYDLPEVSITLEDGREAGFVAVGSSVPVNISIQNYTGSTIPFSFVIPSLANDGKFYFVNDKDEIVRNEFDIEYLNNGGKYYLCADASTNYSAEHNVGIETFKVLVKVQETIMGSVETVSDTLSMQVVEMDIDNISVNGTITNSSNENEMQILHGESMVLSVVLGVNDVKYGDADLLNDLKLKNYSYYPNISVTSQNSEVVFGTKEILEYLFAGTSVQLTKQDDTTGWIDYVTGSRNDVAFKIWFLESEHNGNKEYVALNIGSYDNFNVLASSYRYSTEKYIADFLLYAIKGTTISDDTVIKCSVSYYYDDSGIVRLGNSSQYTTYNLDFEFTLVVSDNSTYDHPNPIENAYDLAHMEAGANYILINNIEVENWVPYAANFATLDGNGYTIKVKSFDFSGIRGSDSVKHAGLFSEISSNTVIKNIVLDTSSLLISEDEMLANLEQAKNDVGNFDASTYKSNYAIDLSFMPEVNFGMLAGLNKGSITNVKLVSTKDIAHGVNYLHVVTSQAYIKGKITSSNIGGIVGVNEGAISNSYVGQNYSSLESMDKSYIEIVTNTSELTYSNVDDEISEVVTYPFIIAGGNQLAGVVAKNSGILSNSYVKGIGLYNTFPIVEFSSTGGVVAENLNTGHITSCFIEGYTIENYRASTIDDYFIESTGNIGGFVYSNSGTIENAYSNISLKTQSSYSGGFVYENTTSGVINYAYSTAVSRQSKAHGQFTGVFVNKVQNYGQYTSCFYLVALESETINVNEPATAIETYSEYSLSNTTGYAFSDVDTWNGFAFVSGNNNDSIWTMPDINSTNNGSDLKGPQINATLTDTISFRRLSNREDKFVTDGSGNVVVDQDGNWVVESTKYEYEYNTYSLGSKENPLIIDTAENFVKYIIDNTDIYNYMADVYTPNGVGDYVKVDGKYIPYEDKYSQYDRYSKSTREESLHVFGAGSLANVGSNSIISNINDVQYVRLVNNLDFSNVVFANSYKGVHLYDIIFAGSLDGNGMTMSSINLTVDNMTSALQNFGLFAQIGLSEEDITNITGVSGITSELQSAVKNMKITVRTYKSNGASKAGVLAGTINNSSIVNIEISAENNSVIVSGLNMSGVVAGLIYSDNDYTAGDGYASASNYSIVRLIDIKIKNIQVESTYNSLGGTLISTSGIVESSYYTKFTIDINHSTVAEVSFNSLYNKELKKTDLSRTKEVSYAGMVAGVISVNNYVRKVGYHGENEEVNEYDRFTYYRTTPSETIIRNIIVSEGFQIKTADNAGGLFGYVGENTHIKESQLVLSDGVTQYIKGDNFVGGIVGENYGILEQVYVAYDDKTQADIDADIYIPTRQVSGDYLFGIKNEIGYTVAVGGIAGYCSNGVILDAYSKVNIVKENLYIAGGLVGYAEGYNYIGFAYTTGSVYSSNAMGGLIGFYKYTLLETEVDEGNYTYAINEKEFLYMKSVVSLTNWSYNTGEINVESSISYILYNNYKGIYSDGNAGFYDFDITMPEIGNQKIRSYLKVDYYPPTETYQMMSVTEGSDYYTANKWGFVGSAIGRALYSTVTELGEPVPSDREQFSTTNKSTQYVFIDNFYDNMYPDVHDEDYDIKKLSVKYFSGVFTNTYGVYASSGTTEEGNKNDSYSDSGFNIVVNGLTKNIGSYKQVGSAYNYEGVDIDGSITLTGLQLNQVRGDILYNKIFSAQEYLQQIIGYYGSESDGGTGENVYKNLFSSGYYSKDRYEFDLSNVSDVDWLNGAYISGNSEGDYTNNIWAVTSYIPSKSFGIYGNIKYITSSQELIDVFSDANNNMTYYMQAQPGDAPYVIDINNSIDNNYGLYRFNNTFTGALRSLDSEKKIEIVINYGGSGQSAVALFRELNSASFYNISFVINVNSTIDIEADKYGYMGLFANRVISTQFQNCEFRVNIYKTEGNSLFTLGVGKTSAEYFGALFGYVSGVNIYSADIVVNLKNNIDPSDKTLVVDDEGLGLKNFSLAMGFVTNTTLNDVSFKAINNGNLSNEGLTLHYLNNSPVSELSIGGFVANIKNSNIVLDEECYDGGVSIVFESKSTNAGESTLVTNIGGLFGNASYTKIKNAVYNGDIEIVSGNSKNVMSVGGVIGFSTYNSLYNTKVSMLDKDTIKDAGNHRMTLTNLSNDNNDVITNIAMGGIIGKNTAGTVVGEIGAVEENTISNMDMFVYIGDNSTDGNNNYMDSVSVGGLVGYSEMSSSLLNRAINTGNILIEDRGVNPIIVSSGIAVGGLVGCANGIVGFNYVYNAGIITSNFAVPVNKLYVGGLIGIARQNINIHYFANYGDIASTYSEIVVDEVTIKGSFASYVGGIVGYNSIVSALQYGYSFGEIYNFNKDVIVSSVAGGNIDSESKNVYFIQEFIDNNYDTDSVFIPIVYADLYDSSFLNNHNIDSNRYTEIEELVKHGFTAEKEGRIFVYTIDGLISPFSVGLRKIDSGINNTNITATGEKYNPFIISGGETDMEFGAYNVILNNIEWNNTTDIILGEDCILSGKTQKVLGVIDDQFITTVLTLKDNEHPFIKENYGVVSNLTVYRSEETDTDYDYEGHFAYGVIENYGTLYKVNTVVVSHTAGTESTSALVSYNEGNILASGAIVLQKYLYSDSGNNIFTSFSGLVWTNVGFISDCYSTSYLYGDIKEGIQSLNYTQYVYGLVAYNGVVDEVTGAETSGIVKYSYHYMNAVNEEDSDTVLYINGGQENYKLIGSSAGSNSLELYVMDKVEIQVLPTWINARNVWVINDDASSNYGYPYIKNTYITGTVVVSIVDVSSIIQNNLYTNDSFTSNDLSIQYSFFKNMNDDNSVIVNTPSKLYSVLSSAVNSTLSNQTILITSDLDMTGYDLNGVISYSYATIIGAVLNGSTYRNAIISNLNINGGSLFGSNYGIVAFLDFENLNVKGDSYVAAICVYNKGTISHVKIRDSYISGNSYVGGIASYNSVPSNISNNVGIYHVSLNNVEIYNGSSSGYTGGICAINEGSTTRNYSYGIVNSSVTDVKIYALGSYCGGIVGRNSGKVQNVVVMGSGSGNRVILSVTGGSYVGGIAGYTTVEITGTTNSVSYAKITGASYVGGYYGYSLSTISNASISDVILTASIKNSLGESYIGGLVGSIASNIVVDEGCVINLSNIDISSYGYYTGGLVGYMAKKFGQIKITSEQGHMTLNNIAIKSGSAYVGGILGKGRDNNVSISGYSNASMIEIKGYLTIKSQYVNSETSYMGGIVSAVASASDRGNDFDAEISYINLDAPLVIDSSQATNYVGGVVGYAVDVTMSGVYISRAYNVEIDVPKANSVGGIMGYHNGVVDYSNSSCVFEIGSVSIHAVSYIGAYIGYISSDLNIDKNISISGRTDNYINIKGNSSSGNIGGVFGYIAGNVVLNSVVSLEYININSSDEIYAGIYYGGVFGNILGTLTMGEESGVSINKMYLYGNSYVGAVTGKVTFVEGTNNVGNISISQTIISASSNYIGGVFGYATNQVDIQRSITINNVKVIGNYYVGGVFGYVGGNINIDSDILVSSVEVKGYSNIGGVFGYAINSSIIVIESGANVRVLESIVESEISAGGLVFSAGFIYIAGTFEFIKGRVITITDYSDSGTAGGIAGILYRSLIIAGGTVNIAGDGGYTTIVEGFKYAGGLVGYLNYGSSSHIENVSVGEPSSDNITDELYYNVGIYMYNATVTIENVNIVSNRFVGGVVGQTNGNMHILNGSSVTVEKSNIVANDRTISYAGVIIGIKYNNRIFVADSSLNIKLDEDNIKAAFVGYIIGYDGRYSIYATSLSTEGTCTISITRADGTTNVSSEYYYGAVSYN